MVMHVSKEKINGSKNLHLISNTHKTAYWLSNYIFDSALCFINISLLMAIIAIVSAIRNNKSTDIYLISNAPISGYLFLMLFLSSLNWSTMAYCWLHFFKSDVTAFVVLFILFGVAAFLDVAFSFIHLFIHITNEDLNSASPSSIFMYVIRLVLCVFFPNVTIKREIFNFKLRSNRYCIDSLNKLFKCKLFLNFKLIMAFKME